MIDVILGLVVGILLGMFILELFSLYYQNRSSRIHKRVRREMIFARTPTDFQLLKFELDEADYYRDKALHISFSGWLYRKIEQRSKS